MAGRGPTPFPSSALLGATSSTPTALTSILASAFLSGMHEHSNNKRLANKEDKILSYDSWRVNCQFKSPYMQKPHPNIIGLHVPTQHWFPFNLENNQ